MKTTVELPDGLVREIKLRAVHDGKKLKDIITDLLRKGLDGPEAARTEDRLTYLVRDERSGLPLIQCQHPARPGQELTAERIADILLEQEVGWQHEAGR